MSKNAPNCPIGKHFPKHPHLQEETGLQQYSRHPVVTLVIPLGLCLMFGDFFILSWFDALHLNFVGKHLWVFRTF